MIIPGKEIAEILKSKIQSDVDTLIRNKINPHLAVVFAGDDPSSLTYIKRKKKVGEELGITVSVYTLAKNSSQKDLSECVNHLNHDSDIHGIIIQRPIPIPMTKVDLDLLVDKEKDVDGFRADSPFTPPIGSAIISILQWIHQDIRTNPKSPISKSQFVQLDQFNKWLASQKILVIGKGETGGKPVADTLRKRGVIPVVADSKTHIDPKNFDIVVSCVGKPNILRHNMVSDKSILIGVGLHSENGRLAPDYDQNDVKDAVAYYTPVPGGVGPVNVTSLFENLIQSAQTFSR